MKDWFGHIVFLTRSQPATTALLTEDRAITYGMLGDAIDRVARRVNAQGLAGDNAVAVLIADPIRHLVVCLALFRLGIVSFSLAHQQDGIRDLSFAAVLGDDKASAALGPAHCVIEVTDSWFSDEVSNNASLPAGFSDALQTCRMALTSGTSGAPKAVSFTIEEIGRRPGLLIGTDWSRLLCLVGLAGSWGFWTACATLSSGGTLCFSTSPYQSARMIELFAIRTVVASTEQLLALTRVVRKTGAHLPSLRVVQIAGTAPSRALLESAAMHVCKSIYCSYAASESGAIAHTAARDILARPGYAGHVLPGVEVLIGDSEGRPVAPGKVGRILVRQKSAQNWTDLGDVGWLDERGELFVAGRAIDVGAAAALGAAAPQISPVYEIEHLLRLEWDAADAAAVVVDEAAGLPQVLIATVDCKDANGEAFERILRARGYDYRVHIIPVPAIPRSVSGKVKRAMLKSMLLGKATSAS